MGLAMNTDTIRLDDPDPDDLDGLAASLDHLRLWSQSATTIPLGNYYRRAARRSKSTACTCRPLLWAASARLSSGAMPALGFGSLLPILSVNFWAMTSLVNHFLC